MQKLNENHDYQSSLDKFKSSVFFKVVDWCLILSMVSLGFILDTMAYRNAAYAAAPPTASVNRKPIANAGPNKTVPLFSDVTLDGSASIDPNGDMLSYRWRITAKPKGSLALLQSSDAFKTKFSIDKAGDYTVELVVNDGKVNSEPVTVRISSKNTPPVARGGQDQTVLTGAKVNFDASGSSDVDSDLLKYSWEIIQRPENSKAKLDNTSSIQPSFRPDKPGEYTVRLRVDDDKGNRGDCDIHISTHDSLPIANAGPDQRVRVNDKVRLDGSKSTDIDGSEIRYLWSFTRLPAGSTARLNNPKVLKPTFVADKAGTYVVQLTVGEEDDCWKKRVGLKRQTDHDCATDTVVITTIDDQQPIANAGPDQTIPVKGTVHLDGNASKDPDGTAITEYSWSFTSLPTNSKAILTNSKVATPDFIADLPGVYVLQLIVKSGGVSSNPDTVIINTINSKPLANAGPAQQVKQKDIVNLNGNLSSDPDNDALSYAWSLLSKPDGSSAIIQPINAINPSFTADLPGDYVLQLIVSDGRLSSDPATTTITAIVPNRVPSITSSPGIAAQVGTVYSYSVIATDPDPNDTLSYALDIGPLGMTINTVSGLINWLPTGTQTGTQPVIVRVKDKAGLFALQTYNIAVTTPPPVNQPPVITSAAVTSATVGQPYSYDVNATDPDIGDTLTYTLTSTIAGMTIDAITGVITWNPAANQSGTQAVTVKVQDKAGLSVSQSFSIVVSTPPPVNQPPVITSTAVTIATVGKLYNYDVDATDPDVGDSLTYSLTTQTTGMTVNATTGVIAWTPAANQTGANSVTVQVSDGRLGGVVSQTFTIQVAAANTRNIACKTRSDNYSTRADQILSVPVPGVLGNDKFSPGDFLTALKLTDPTRGALNFNNNGAFNYTPNASNQTCTAPPAAGISFVEPLGIPLGVASDALINIRGLAKADFNHDGFLDLAVTGQFSFGWRISVVMGKGDGTFQPPVVLQTLNGDVRPSGILAKDVDDDCNLDLFVAVEFTKEVLFFKGQGDGNFDVALPTALTITPQGLQSADLNNDGKLDLVTLNSNNGSPGDSVSVLISNGIGTFQSPVTYPTNAGVTDLALGDVNGDGAPDVVVSSTISSLSILLNTNTGTGTFAAAQQSPVNVSQMSGLFLGDFNRDNKLDVVVGGFQCQWTGGNPSGLGTTGSPGCMTFIPGNGDGSFTAPESTVPNLSPFTTAMAWFPSRGRYSENVAPDVNGDGILDVVFGELPEQGAGNYLHVRLGKGDGTFSTTAWVASAGQSVGAPPLTNIPDSVSGLGSAVIDDFTGDGVMDIATALGNANGISSGRAALLVGTTPGKFASPGIFPLLEPPFRLGGFSGGGALGFYPMTLGDFTNDGQPELAVVGGFNRLGLMPLASDGTLGPVKTGISLPTSDGGGEHPLNADFDRDGNLDVAFLGRNQQRGVSIYIVYGDGTGQFANPVEIRPTVNTPFGNIVEGDFNNDGFPDIAAHSYSKVDIYLGTGGSRSFTQFSPAGGSLFDIAFSQPPGIVTSDFDQDGTLDLVISLGFSALINNAVDAQRTLFLRGNGDGSFQPAVVIARDIIGGILDYAAGDVNHDGKQDIISIAQFSAVHVQLGNGDGTFSAPVLYDTKFAGSAGQVVLADFDWDGHLDIALTTIGFNNTSYGLGVLRGLGDGSFAPIQRLAYGVTGRFAGSLIATDVNNDGRPDLITGGPDTSAQDFTVLLNNSASVNSCTNTDSFTYKASDGTFDSLPMTVGIVIKPSNHPPVVISTPITTTNTGQLYVYDVNATDQDAGERLAYALTKAPSGMTIEADTGVIEWRPATNQSGPQPVIVRVYDNNGVFAEQSFTLTVAQRVTVPSVVGLSQAAARTAITNVALAFGTVTTQHSPIVPAGNVISQSPAPGLSVAQNTSVNVVVSQGPLVIPGLTSITLNLATPAILVNGSQNFTATGELSGGGTVAITDGLTWSSSNPGIATISPLGVVTGIAAGTTTITATLGGVTSTFNLTVRATVSGDAILPTAAITTPAAGAEVTSPIDVIGTATDANFFRYELSYAVSGDSNFTKLASGSNPVNNGVLGQFDPTLLINDLYDLKLTVFDLGGNQSESVVTVQVSRELKVGLFTLTFQDLNIPLSGIPITINRTYDSRDKGQGDFGVGWRLDVQSLRVRLNREQGTGWTVNLNTGLGGINNYQLVPGSEHKVSLTLPGGKVEEFDLNINPNVSPFFKLGSVTANYVPRSGTLGSLVSIEDNDLLVFGDQPGNVTLVTIAGANTFNPKRFRYTSADGTIIDIDRTKGVEKVQDLNGNTLTFTPLGIVHSSGKSVRFTRDAQGRITDITDPSGNVRSYAYNASGDLISATDFVGKTTSFTYNNSHGLLDIIDPTGTRVARNEYDANGRLISTTDANGKVVTFVHNLNTRQEVTTDRLGNVTAFEYDEVGNVVSKTDALGGKTTYSYDSNGNELTVTDPLGRVATKTYDTANNILTSTDVDGNTTTNTYNNRKQVLTTRDPDGRINTNVYDGGGNLTQTTNPEGGITRNTYNVAGNRLTTTDPLGNVTAFTYDTNGNKMSQTDALGTVTTFAYNTNGNVLSSTKAGRTTQFQYDAAQRVTRTTDALGNQSVITYSSLGDGQKVASTTDPRGGVTQFSYDASGNEIAKTFPNGSIQAKTYDAENHLLSQTDRDSNKTTYQYDALGRVAKITNPDSTTSLNTYDAIGLLLTRTDENGNVTTYSSAANKRTITDALGNVTVHDLDSNKRIIRTRDFLGQITSFAYDGYGNLIRTTFADGTTKTTTYDVAGQKTAETDQAGLTLQFAYDDARQLIRATNALGGINRYAYDSAGNRITETDANGHITQLQYDAANRLTKRIRPLGQEESFAYDANGNKVSTTDFNGVTTTYTYDSVNQLTAKTLPGGAIVTYAFSDSGLRTQAGGDSYSYDARGRLAQETKATGEVLSYTYDAAGNKTSLTTPQGRTDYTYDARNRLATVVDTAGVTTYNYDAEGNLKTTALPNGISTTYTYNNLNRLIRVESSGVNGLISSYAYTLGATGNRVQVVEAGSATTGRTVSYTYDSVYRLTQEVIDEPGAVNDLTIAYTYDAVGNRTQMNRGGAITAYTYDNNDQLLTEVKNAVALASTYDANGNLKTKGTDTYTFDAENRLVSANTSSGAVSNTYDADGMRISKTANGLTTAFLLDKNVKYARVVTETTGAAIATYTYGNQLINQTRTGGAIHFYLSDGQLSTRQLSTPSGIVSDTYSFDAFGVMLASTGTTPNTYLYTGEQLDANVGFYYLRARYYDQGTGRFISTDPEDGNVYDPLSLHRYVYANGDPMKNTDPSGRSTLIDSLLSLSLLATLIFIYTTISFGPHNSWESSAREGDIVARVQSVKNITVTNPTNPPMLEYFRNGVWHEAPENTELQIGDLVRTDKQTVAAIEFGVGGRVGINQGTEIQIVSERAVADGRISFMRKFLKNWALWTKADAKALKEPIEIQTNGGVMGIKG